MKTSSRKPTPKTRKPQRRLRAGRLLWLLLFVAVLIAAIAYGTYSAWRYVDYTFNNNVRDAAFDAPHYDSAKLVVAPYRNSLIVGLDTKKANVEADYFAILSMPVKTGYVPVVCQLPAEMQINFEGNMRTLRDLYAYGGATYVANALVREYSIPVTNYFALDYQSLIECVDLADGAELFVESNFDYDDKYSNTAIHIKSGFQHFDGKTAVDYVRFRNDELGLDGRTKRQSRIIRELWPKVLSYRMLLHPVAVYDIYRYKIHTDLTPPQLLSGFCGLGKSKSADMIVFNTPGSYMNNKSATRFAVDAPAMREFVNSCYYRPLTGGNK